MTRNIVTSVVIVLVFVCLYLQRGKLGAGHDVVLCVCDQMCSVHFVTEATLLPSWCLMLGGDNGVEDWRSFLLHGMRVAGKQWPSKHGPLQLHRRRGPLAPLPAERGRAGSRLRGNRRFVEWQAGAAVGDVGG